MAPDVPFIESDLFLSPTPISLSLALFPSPSLALSPSRASDAFTLEYTRQPPSCASIQPADMCHINYISVNALSAELAWTGSRGPRVSNHSGPLFLVLCVGRQAS